MRIFGIILALVCGVYTESFAARGFWGILLYIFLIGIAVLLTSDIPKRLVKNAQEKKSYERRRANW